MKIKVNPHTLEIQKNLVNEREIDITKCEFEFSEEITQEYVKEAYFTFEGTSYKEIIINNQCNIPNEVLAKKGQIEIGVVAYLVESEEEIKRYNPSPAYFSTLQGSLKDNAENSEPITPSEMEQFEQALQDGINQIANIDINAEQTESGGIVEVTNKDGETTTITLTNGVDGEQGPQGIQGPVGPQGPQGIQGIQGPQGEKGSKGDKGDKGDKGATGQDGADGRDAKINGVNTLTIEAGSNINIEQEGSTMTISSTGGSGGTSDYSELSNKPKINNVELNGNKTTSDLGINIPDVSNFITKDVNNLTYYTLATGTGSTIELSINSSTYVMTLNLKNSAGTTISTDTIDLPLETMVVGGSYDAQNKKVILTLKNGETVEFSVADLVSGLQSEITSSNKLSSDLVDDTNNTNKFVTASDKTTWSGKQDALVSGTNIKTINNSSILGSGNLTIDGVKILDVTNITSQNPVIFDDLDIGEYIIYFNNTSSFLTTKNVYFKNKSTDSSSEYSTLVSGATLKVIKKMENMTNRYDYMGEISYIYCENNNKYKLYICNIGKTNGGNIEFNIVSNKYLVITGASPNGAKMLRTDALSNIYWDDFNSIGSNYDATKTQYLKNVSGTMSWVEETIPTPTMIYLGKINSYDTSAKALDVSNYSANTRIVLKNNDSTRSFYIKVGSNVAEVPATSASDVSVINNIFYVDINSISGSTANIAVVWASTYQWCPIVTNTIMVSFTSSGATVGNVTRNMQGYTLFQLEEDSNGDLDTTTLQEFVAIRTATFSKQRAPQRPAIHYLDKDKNSCLLSFTSLTSGSQQVYEGIMTTKQPNVNGFYETYKVRLELNYSGTTYSNHVLTKTKIGVVLDGEVEEKDMVVTYSDNTTETVKLVVYR